MTSSADHTYRAPGPAFAARPPRPRLNVLDKLQTASVFYIGAWALSPPLFVNNYARIGAALALALWTVCELSRGGGIFLRPGRPVIIAVFYLAYTTAVVLYADGVGALVSRIQLVLFVLFFIQFQAARRHGLMKYRWMLWPSLALFSLWTAITLGALRSDNHIAREMVRSSEDTLQYAAGGIGGYGLVYAALWALPALAYIGANLPPLPGPRAGRMAMPLAIAMRMLVFGTLALASLLVLGSGYSIAVISFLAGLMAYGLLRGRASGRGVRIAVASLIAVLGLAFSQSSLPETTLEGLSSLTEGTNYHLKVEDMLASMNSESAVGTVHDRTDRYVRSLQLFATEPIRGVLSFRDVGKHSLTLDNLAQFGLLGGGALIYVLLALPLTLMRASSRQPELAGAAFAFLVVVVICAGLNNVSASMGFVAYILYPLAMSLRPRTRRVPVRSPGPHPGQAAHFRPAGAKRPSY